jgi:hypothetical protein
MLVSVELKVRKLSKSCLKTWRSVYAYIKLLSTSYEINPTRNSIYAHAQDFAMSGELLLAILKAFVPEVNKQQIIGFRVFTYIRYI